MLPALVAGACLAWAGGLWAQTYPQSNLNWSPRPAGQAAAPAAGAKLKWLPGLPEAPAAAVPTPVSEAVVSTADNAAISVAPPAAASLPASQPASLPASKPASAPTGIFAGLAADPPADTPASAAAEHAARPVADRATDMSVARPVDQVAERSADRSAESPAMKAMPSAEERDAFSSLLAQSPGNGKQRLPTITESLARKEAPVDVCPSPNSLKRINKITTDIVPEKGDFPPECGLGKATYQPRCWGTKRFTWTAAGLCHKPLYFEDEQLERYGHSMGLLLDPPISTAKFFLTFPMLPYAMGLCPPNECVYTLGTYRPGDCSPFTVDAVPISVRAGLLEAGACVGIPAILP